MDPTNYLVELTQWGLADAFMLECADRLRVVGPGRKLMVVEPDGRLTPPISLLIKFIRHIGPCMLYFISIEDIRSEDERWRKKQAVIRFFDRAESRAWINAVIGLVVQSGRIQAAESLSFEEQFFRTEIHFVAGRLLKKKDLYEAYENWCLGIRNRAVSKIAFKKALVEWAALTGIPVGDARKAATRLWSGVCHVSGQVCSLELQQSSGLNPTREAASVDSQDTKMR